jgi:hypothetical protein
MGGYGSSPFGANYFLCTEGRGLVESRGNVVMWKVGTWNAYYGTTHSIVNVCLYGGR